MAGVIDVEELQTGLDFLQSAIPQERKEVSLETLTDEERKKIMNAYTQCRDVAKNYYLETIQPALIKRKDIYDALPKLYRKKFPELSELTDWVSKDVKTAIDWMIPALIDVFCGTDDPCDIRGVDLNDDLAARKLQSIIKYQVNKKNNYFVFLINMLREGLITNEGVAKVYWNRDESREEMEVWIDETNLAEYIQMAQMGQIEIKELEMMGENGLVGGRIKFDKITVHFNAPVLENMSPSELRFTPDGRTLQESKFVAQRKIVKGDYLKRKESEGVFSNVDKAIKEAGDSAWTEYDRKRNDWLDSTGISSLSDNDSASKLVELYEAYIDVDYNNDGVLEKLIVHAVGDTPVSIQENTFRNVPFFIFSPEQDPYSPFGKVSVADALEQLQDLKTALIRQMIIAIGKNNRPQRFVNTSKVDMDSLLDGDEIIPVLDGEPSQAVYSMPHIPLDPATMTMIEYTQNEVESQSGSTKYNQGLDSNSLNKTASGINAIMGAADKKLRLIARVFAETAWVPILKHIIKLNQQFLDPYQQFRLDEQMVSIAPEELDIDYDLTVNTGQGAATKEAQMNYLIMLMQQLFPTLQQMGIANEVSWYEATKDLLEKMGIRNVQTYLLDPHTEEFKQLQAQKAEEAQKQATAQIEAMKELQQFKLEAEMQRQSIPRTSMNYKDLPLEAKLAAIKQILGIDIPPQQVVEKEVIDAQKGGR